MRTRSWKQALGKRKFVVTTNETTAGTTAERLLRAANSPTAAAVARVLVAIATLGILFCGLFPFDLVVRNFAHQISARFDWSMKQYFTSGDTWENTLFFMPFGFALGICLNRKIRQRAIVAAITAGAALALSSFIEVSQCFIVDRDPSLTDILNNTIGGALGAAIGLAVGLHALGWISLELERRRRWFGKLTMTTIAAVATLAAIIVPIALGKNGALLTPWSPAFGLAIGNEIGAQRWWLGRVGRLAIASRAASDEQINELLRGASPTELFGPSLCAWYEPIGEPPFVDYTGQNRPLEEGEKIGVRSRDSKSKPASRPSIPPTSQPGVLEAWPLSKDSWLRTAGGVPNLVHDLTSTDQFTVLLVCASDRPDQFQQARLATISGGSSRRDLTFAQDGTSLVIRVRSHATGENGAAPEFVIDDVFVDSSLHTIVATYDAGRLGVTIDDPSHRMHTRITPTAAAIWALYPRPYFKFEIGEADAILAGAYRILAFTLIGGLVALACMRWRKTFDERIKFAAMVLVVAIALLELTLTFVGGEPFHFVLPLISAISAGGGVVLIGMRAQEERVVR